MLLCECTRYVSWVYIFPNSIGNNINVGEECLHGLARADIPNLVTIKKSK
jgi:hypothetical protein